MYKTILDDKELDEYNQEYNDQRNKTAKHIKSNIETRIKNIKHDTENSTKMS